MVDDTRVALSLSIPSSLSSSSSPSSPPSPSSSPSFSPSSSPTPSLSSPSSSSLPKSPTHGKMMKIIKMIIIIMVVGVCLGFVWFETKKRFSKNLSSLVAGIKALKILGNLIIAAAYLPAGLPFAIVSYYVPLSLSAGYLYQDTPLRAFLTTMSGSVAGSLFGFWVTRRFCRHWVEEKIKASTRLSALMQAMETHSFKVTIISRFLPLPFGLQNGLCAMTNITPRMFVVSSFIGLMPENILLLYFGSITTDITDVGKSSPRERILLGAAVLATVVVVIVGRKILDATLAKARAGNKKTEDDVELLDKNIDDFKKNKNKNGNGSDDDDVELGGENNFDSAESPPLLKSSSKISFLDEHSK